MFCNCHHSIHEAKGYEVLLQMSLVNTCRTLGSVVWPVNSFSFEKLTADIFKAVFAVYLFFEDCLKMLNKEHTYIF